MFSLDQMKGVIASYTLPRECELCLFTANQRRNNEKQSLQRKRVQRRSAHARMYLKENTFVRRSLSHTDRMP